MQISNVSKTSPEGADAGKAIHLLCAKRSPRVKAVLSHCMMSDDECLQVMFPAAGGKDCLALATSLSPSLKPIARKVIDNPLQYQQPEEDGSFSVFAVTNCPTAGDGTAIVIRFTKGQHQFSQTEIISEINLGISFKFGKAADIPLPE
ncbi:MAG: hypothetical protein HQ592_04600 [Planctomycetes bacterium]|nr:hypothetical protein [Planctomycetota bacterium]